MLRKSVRLTVQFILRGDPDVRGRFAVWQNVNAPGYFSTNTTSNVIMVTAIDALAREYENLSDEDITEQAMLVLREMYGPSIPSPTSIVVPRWTLDPLYRGSYSNWPIGVLDQHHSNLRQPVGGDRVWFTGEAMSEEAFGYVQGAWNEGAATAKAIGECLTDGVCEGAEIYPALKICQQEAQTEQPFGNGAAMSAGGAGARKNKGAAMRHGLPGASVRQKRALRGD
jgi:polyamine oxidase